MLRSNCFGDTGDKMWVYFYESETTIFSVENPALSCLENAGQVRPNIKSLLVIFYCF
jgi:hypothetical protein